MFNSTEQENRVLTDIIDIFNLKGVELVRLSGLYHRQKLIDDTITPQILHIIINKFRDSNIIKYETCCFCPHCHEIFYLKNKETEHRCDTCGMMFTINITNLITGRNIDGIIKL